METTRDREILQKYVNLLLQEIVEEAKNVGIPVSRRILKDVKINPRPKKRFGCCRKEGRDFQIEISRFVLDAPEAAVRNVIAHEVLHACKGALNHQDKWKEYAALMNRTYGYAIKRTNSFEELGLPKPEDRRTPVYHYIVRCKRCGKEFKRQRASKLTKHPGLYRCQCGGRLEVVKYSNVNIER